MGAEEKNPASSLPPPCAHCGRRLGVYEPIVILISGRRHATSWLRLHPDQRHGIRAWHPACVPDPAHAG